MASMVNNIPGVLHRLSYGLILHPIGAALGFIAVVFGLIGIAAASRFATIMMSLAAALGALVTLVVFVFDMVIFNILRNRVRGAGGDAMLVSFLFHFLQKVRADVKREMPTGSLLVPLSLSSYRCALHFVEHAVDSPVDVLPERRYVTISIPTSEDMLIISTKLLAKTRFPPPLLLILN